MNSNTTKVSLTPVDKIFHRILWDGSLNADEFEIGYVDHFKEETQFIPLRDFRGTSEEEDRNETKDIPFHRVSVIRWNKSIDVWDKANKINVLDNVAQNPNSVFGVLDEIFKSCEIPTLSELTPSSWHTPSLQWNQSCDSEYGCPVNSRQVGSTISFVTYNVLFDFFQISCIDERIQLLLRQLQQLNADVVGLQEVTPSFLKTLLKNDFIRNTYYISDVNGHSVTPLGQVILSKWPLKNAHIIHLSPHKTILFCKLDIIGYCSDVTIACVHLVSDFAKNAPERRIRDMKKLFEKLEKCKECFVLGDFNFGDEAVEQSTLDVVPNIFDVWRVLPENSNQNGFTYDPLKNTLATLTADMQTTPQRFDRILFRSTKLRPVAMTLECTESIQVSNEGTTTTAENKENIPIVNNLFGSDHYALLAVFEPVNKIENEDIAV